MEEIPDKEVISWAPFLKAELINAINRYNNYSTPGPDKLSWRHLKKIVKNKECINKLIDIANICIDLGLSQIRYLLVVILELNSISEVQYKDMMIDRWWKVSIGIIDVIKSEI